MHNAGVPPPTIVTAEAGSSPVRGGADDDLPLPCPGCGYDLRATQSDRCPECGATIDELTRSGEATIPWQQRRRIGRVRAFLATLNWALFHPSRLAKQAGRRVDYASARRFQLICCLIGTAGFAIFETGDLWEMRGEIVNPSTAPAATDEWQPSCVANAGDAAILAAIWLAVFLWLLLGTGVASYFFHPRRLPAPLQARAVALSYYASAPVALWLLVEAAWTGAQSIATPLAADGEAIAPAIIWGFAGLLVLWCVVWTWWLPAHLLMNGLHASGGRAAALLLTTALAWPLLLVLVLILVPGLVFFVQFLWLLL